MMLSQNKQPIALISFHGDPAAVIGAEETGGQNVYVRNVGEKLAALGWQVDMFTRKISPDQASIVQHSPYCRTIRLNSGPEKFVPRDQLFDYLPEFVDAFLNWQREQNITYPLIHTNYWLSGWIGLQLKKLCQIQQVHTYHSLGTIKYQSVPNRPAIADTRELVEKYILQMADCVVATSPQEREMLNLFVSDSGQIEIIPCGTDTDNFHFRPKSEARAKLGLDVEDKIVLYVGRFDPRKGIETLVRAFGLMKSEIDDQNQGKVKLVIVGGSTPERSDGAEKLRIEQIVQDLDLSADTIFAGQVEHDLLPFYYSAADVCVIPSHYEPFGLVAIEAMACGTPVVASDVGGLKFTVLPEETGLLVPPQNDQAFANAITRILCDQIWARKLKKQASANVNERFSWNGVGIQLSDLYRRLLAQSLMQESLVTNKVANFKYPVNAPTAKIIARNS